MSAQELITLTQRLADAEAAIANLRRDARLRTLGPIFFVATLAIAATYWGSTALHADAPGPHIVQAPFTVIGPHGAPILTVRAAESGDQNQLVFYGDHGNVAAVMLSTNGKGLIAVGDGSGQVGGQGGLKAALAVDDRGNGTLEIGDASNATIAKIAKGPNTQGLAIYRPGTNKIAVDALANDAVAKISVRNPGGEASGIAAEDDASLVLSDRSGLPFATVETTDGGQQTGASPSTNKDRGLYIYNDKGAIAVKALANSEGSGRVLVSSEDNKQGSALLGVGNENEGGQLLLAGPKNTLAFHLTSADPAGLFMFNKSGNTILELTTATRGGRIWLGDNAGVPMLEGGVNADGLGVFRAGPRVGGPVELSGLPFAIMGKK